MADTLPSRSYPVSHSVIGSERLLSTVIGCCWSRGLVRSRIRGECASRTAVRQTSVLIHIVVSDYEAHVIGKLLASLPDNLRDPAVGSDSFRRSLKTFLFAMY